MTDRWLWGTNTFTICRALKLSDWHTPVGHSIHLSTFIECTSCSTTFFIFTDFQIFTFFTAAIFHCNKSEGNYKTICRLRTHSQCSRNAQSQLLLLRVASAPNGFECPHGRSQLAELLGWDCGATEWNCSVQLGRQAEWKYCCFFLVFFVAYFYKTYCQRFN